MKAEQRLTWSPHAFPAWYIGPALEHYRCYTVWNIKTRHPCHVNQLIWFPPKPFPKLTSADLLRATIEDLRTILLSPPTETYIGNMDTFPIAKKSRMPFDFQYWNHVGFYVKSTTLLFYLSLTLAAVCTSGAYSFDPLYPYYINADLVLLQLRRATGLHSFLTVDPPGCSSPLPTNNIFTIKKRFATVSSPTLLPSLLPAISHTLSMRPRSEPVTLLPKSPLLTCRYPLVIILNRVNRLVTSSESFYFAQSSCSVRIYYYVATTTRRLTTRPAPKSPYNSHCQALPLVCPPIATTTTTTTSSSTDDFPPVGQATVARLPGPHTRLRNDNVFIYKKAVATAIAEAMPPPLRPALFHILFVSLGNNLS